MAHYILQAEFGIDIWSQLSSVAGIVGVILAIGVVTLWLELKNKDKALAILNDHIKKDAKESMQIITSFEALIDQMLSKQADGEKRIIDSVVREAGHLKELIHAYKKHNTAKEE